MITHLTSLNKEQQFNDKSAVEMTENASATREFAVNRLFVFSFRETSSHAGCHDLANRGSEASVHSFVFHLEQTLSMCSQ